MPRRFYYPNVQLTQPDTVPFSEEAIELAPVGSQASHIENPGECGLYGTNALAAGYPGAGAPANFTSSSQVVGMSVGFQHPLDLQALVPGSVQHFVHKGAVRHSTDRVVHPDGVDYRGAMSCAVAQEVGPGT